MYLSGITESALEIVSWMSGGHSRPDHDEERKEGRGSVLTDVIDALGQGEEDVRDVHSHVDCHADIGKLNEAVVSLSSAKSNMEALTVSM